MSYALMMLAGILFGIAGRMAYVEIRDASRSTASPNTEVVSPRRRRRY